MVALVLPLLLLVGIHGESRPDCLAITNVTVIDATDAPPRHDMTVVITAGRIAAMMPSDRVHLPRDARVVDGTGKFLIPGLWDMHVHTAHADTFFPLFIVNGVTGIRDVGMSLDRLKAWRREIETGKRVGPRMVIAGPIIDGLHSVLGKSALTAESAADARRVISQLKDGGSDFIKVYNFLSRDAFFALADEARKRHMPFAGHVPLSVGASEASDAGQRSIEHLTGVLLACSHREKELRRKILSTIREAEYSPRVVNRLIFSAPPREIVDTFSPEKAAALFAKFARNGTWQVPTLHMLRLISFGNEQYRADPRLKYIAWFIQEDWARYEWSRTPEELVARQRLFQTEREAIRGMHRAGVKFLAGTDAPNPYVFPGFALHDELEMLVQAGFTPLEALQSATSNPARFLGLLDSTGTVSKGKQADLVLLAADPLQDIRNTRQVVGVALRGRYFDKIELQQMLGQAELAACKDDIY